MNGQSPTEFSASLVPPLDARRTILPIALGNEKRRLPFAALRDLIGRGDFGNAFPGGGDSTFETFGSLSPMVLRSADSKRAAGWLFSTGLLLDVSDLVLSKGVSVSVAF